MPRRRAGKSAVAAAKPALVRVAREDHPISRSQLTKGTLNTLYGLKDAGYQAYVVGGGVRDLLAGKAPKDFDIATDARPEQVRKIFRSCRTIGRRFVICHVRWGREVSEVTTFRGALTAANARDDTGRILDDNDYGTLESDAFRRDFTVNALYYDIRDFAIVDYVGGLADMRAQVIRLIGDPETRYREDPVRMLRAVRIANKLRFEIEPGTAAAIAPLAHLLREIPPARLFDEVIKLLQSVDGVANLQGLHDYGLLKHLLPGVDAAFRDAQALAFINRALANTAERIGNEQSVNPAFLYAALLWPAVQKTFARLVADELHPNVAIHQAADVVLAKVQPHVVIPKRFSVQMREIWMLQLRLEQMPRTARARRVLSHPRFRAAYDFLLLRVAIGELPQALGNAWTRAHHQHVATVDVSGDGVETDDAADDFPAESVDEVTSAPRKRRRRGGRNRRRSAPPAAE